MFALMVGGRQVVLAWVVVAVQLVHTAVVMVSDSPEYVPWRDLWLSGAVAARATLALVARW
jgi:hypothetical protein